MSTRSSLVSCWPLQYEADLRLVSKELRTDNLDSAVAIAALPDMIRGFGPVKEANRAKAMARRETLLAELCAEPRKVSVAAE